MKNIYEILEQIEKLPALYLGNNFGIIALNNFITGYIFGGGKLYEKKLNCPDFSLFSDWLGGMFNASHEQYSMNWSWLLLEKYKDDKRALKKFFFYLKKFKSISPEVIIVPLTGSDIIYALDNKPRHLKIGLSNQSKSYDINLKKIDRIILFRLLPSKTLFSLLVSKNNEIIDGRNIDMTEKSLRKKIEIQFGINLSKYKKSTPTNSTKTLQLFNLI